MLLGEDYEWEEDEDEDEDYEPSEEEYEIDYQLDAEDALDAAEDDEAMGELQDDDQGQHPGLESMLSRLSSGGMSETTV